MESHSVSSDGLVAPLRGGASLAIVGVFLFITAGTGIVDALWPVSAPRVVGWEADEEARRRDRARVWDGTRARLLERDLNRTSRIRRLTLPFWVSALYAATGATNPNVIVGKDDWLFLPAFMPRESRITNPALAHAADMVAALHRRLSLLGIRLVMAPVPAKSMVHPEKLPSEIRALPHLHARFLQLLEDRGVDSVDLLAAFSESKASAKSGLFCRTDTHWNCAGALVAAEAIARGAGVSIPPSQRTTELRKAEPLWDAGDGLRFLGLDSERLQGPCPEQLMLRAAGRLHRLEVQRVHDEAGEALNFLDLQGDRGAEVLMVGTSFTNASGFRDYLGHITNRGVHVTARVGGGPFRAMKQLIDSGFTTVPRAIVWEFPLFNLLRQGGRPLYGLVDIAASIPAPPLTPLTDLSSPLTGGVELPPDLVELKLPSPKGLLPGADLTGGGTVRGRIAGGVVLHPGDGTVSLRLRGRVHGAACTVTVGRARGMRATWPEGRPELVIPLVGCRGEQDLLILVRGPSGPSRLELNEVALVVDAVAKTSHFAIGEQQGLDYRYTLNLGDQPPSVLVIPVSLRDKMVTAYLAGGMEPLTGRLPVRKESNGLILVSVEHWDAPHELTLFGSGRYGSGGSTGTLHPRITIR